MAKRGPVPRGAYPNKSAVLSTRIRADTRRALELAASSSARSLSQEIEHRLRRSFDSDEAISSKYGNRQNYALLRIIASLMEMVPGESNSWVHDANNFDHMVHSINVVLRAIRPPGADPLPGEDAQKLDETDRWLGMLNATNLAQRLRNSDATMPPSKTQDALPFIKSDLGEISGRIEAIAKDESGFVERVRKPRSKKP